MKAQERYATAVDLADDVEALVRRAERNLERAVDPTMRDICETELQAALEVQDAALAAAAPAIEAHRQQVADAGREAIRAVQGDPSADWTAKHRRYHTAATKSWLVARVGRRLYLSTFPW